MTCPERSFLLKLNEMTQKNLAESRNLNNATVTRALERLEKKGFVKRVDDEKIKEKRMFYSPLKENKFLLISLKCMMISKRESSVILMKMNLRI